MTPHPLAGVTRAEEKALKAAGVSKVAYLSTFNLAAGRASVRARVEGGFKDSDLLRRVADWPEPFRGRIIRAMADRRAELKLRPAGQSAVRGMLQMMADCELSDVFVVNFRTRG